MDLPWGVDKVFQMLFTPSDFYYRFQVNDLYTVGTKLHPLVTPSVTNGRLLVTPGVTGIRPFAIIGVKSGWSFVSTV